ncbi:hypothetical protein GOP47_0028018 [Adiantum capillus-veneris]|nr:hypothetical protein GOP47_0028018 [Adiantum capillus-veneris]
MQGAGQPCLGEHVEVCFEVSGFVCGRGELAPADDSMEANTGATYESEAPCNKEGSASLAGDEVFEEQVVALSGHVLEYEEMVLEPCLEDLDTGLQREQACLAMHEVEANGRVLLLYAMLLIAMLFQVALQGVLCRFHCSYHKGDDIESSLASDMIEAYGTNASSVRKYSYGGHEDLWIQSGKDPCYEELEGWLVYWGAKKGLDMHVL